MNNKSRILAIDPGHFKFGIAVVNEDRQIMERGVYNLELLYPTVERMAKEHSVARIVIGNGTNSNQFEILLQDLPIPIEWVDERGSTEEARSLFDEFYPPEGLRKWIPRGLRLPNRDYDDLAALVIAYRYLDSLMEK